MSDGATQDWPRASEWLASDAADPSLVVAGAPTSSASLSPSQAWRTPAALRETLARFSTFDGETGIELQDLAVRDDGDLALAELAPADAVTALGTAVADLPPEPTYAFVGGDNLITFPVVAAHPAADLERVGVLTLDAHHDVRPYEGTPSNGAPIRALLDAGLPGSHVRQVGIHSFANAGVHRRFCDEHGIGVVTMADVDQHGIEAVVTRALDELASECEAIHVDLDIDVLDRAFAPGCPGARPGGLTPRQLAAAARRCGAHPAVASVDLVEVDASADIASITLDALAATLLAFASGRATRDHPHDQATRAGAHR